MHSCRGAESIFTDSSWWLEICGLALDYIGDISRRNKTIIVCCLYGCLEVCALHEVGCMYKC